MKEQQQALNNLFAAAQQAALPAADHQTIQQSAQTLQKMINESVEEEEPKNKTKGKSKK